MSFLVEVTGADERRARVRDHRRVRAENLRPGCTYPQTSHVFEWVFFVFLGGVYYIQVYKNIYLFISFSFSLMCYISKWATLKCYTCVVNGFLFCYKYVIMHDKYV